MAENLLTATMPDTPPAPPSAPAPAVDGRPPLLPEKFWDPQAGAVRVDALLKSYLELERRLAAGVDPARINSLLGVPDHPDGYCIACDHGMFTPDPEINTRLHGAGFSPQQAQLVYDLAAERLIPLIQQLAAEFQAEREVERLVEHFGGEAKWREVSRQLLAWAGKNLPAAAVEGLSTTYEGVMALHKMMTGGEPSALGRGEPAGAVGESDLHALMRDPRYWRERDPATIAKVTEGFQRLYPGA
ncbi:MAG TPA: hypothetical protein VD995_05375 [Azospirillum sp.]|nr:hypothetical protein [Azospirillum sp.]